MAGLGGNVVNHISPEDPSRMNLGDVLIKLSPAIKIHCSCYSASLNLPSQPGNYLYHNKKMAKNWGCVGRGTRSPHIFACFWQAWILPLQFLLALYLCKSGKKSSLRRPGIEPGAHAFLLAFGKRGFYHCIFISITSL